MNRILGAAVMCLVLLAGAASPAWAQTYRRENRRANYARRYDDNRRYNDRSVWERSRDKLTVAGGAGAGAAVGGLVGGQKGAIIGALVGAGGSALYTYKLRDRDNRRSRYRR
ncbi:MAG TPA: glycine zipper domain-containing protein [Pyrinomonadaceae bacterium]|jgi:outer membrane lipoprotein SlyB